MKAFYTCTNEGTEIKQSWFILGGQQLIGQELTNDSALPVYSLQLLHIIALYNEGLSETKLKICGS